MKLSTRSRYGLRLMFELALHFGKGSVFLKDIAKKQDISEKYLSKLIIPLKAAKLVNSARGAHGGYTIAREPSLITVREIVEVLEGDISPVECVKNSGVCKRASTCPTRDIWCSLEREIFNVLENITLQNIVRTHETKSAQRNFSYTI
ncbi:MAG: Rrf2 family protein [Candidatus Uhrbacteria bacterium GW2011_GWF2_39_13]|uniref:Rrf2 family protein n=1 Tax=Candidatus Uhrbacteria bacterium GW2011_GWF2_39_13 TaxID=1618995 RepID=A0A0G0MK61_9BACT|nr:MAG: Rrf2 family protein [Candidatus Uhrbacteria bacterium GW2011_GWF2_39_13]